MPETGGEVAATGADRTARGARIGAGERSARRILVVDSALLILIVVAVHLAFLTQGGQGDFPLWALGIAWFAAAVTIGAGIVARHVSDVTLRVLAVIAVAAYWATLITFPAAVPAEGIARIPWTLSASGAAAAAALVAGGRRLAWVTVIAGFSAGIAYRMLFGGLDLDGVVNDLQALLTGAVVCVIGGHILAVGRGLDGVAASTTTAAARESAERGRLAARTRAAALVHDEVLATLSLAASDLPIPRARLAGQAREAAAMVVRLADEEAHEPAGLLAALAEEARSHGAAFSVRDDATTPEPADASIDSATQQALLGATRQALRNSVQHAPEAAREVVLVHAPGEIRVEIIDDGPGFDPDRVADDRLGIRQSIVGRMSRLAGGGAEVLSAPGAGTIIRLRRTTAVAPETGAATARVSLRRGVTVIAIVYVVTQALSALLAAFVVPDSWPLQLAMLATALIAAEILRSAPRLVPSRLRTGFVVLLACGGLIAGTAAAHFGYGMSPSYGTMWFAVAFAFLFVALALRKRIAVALVGTGVIVAVLVGAGMLAGAPPGQIVQVATRPVVIVALAVALLVVVERMQRRIAVLHRDALASAERESWTLAARSELTGRVAELARTALPLLHRIGEGAETTEAERREYASCEGELRDGLRAGSLSREPLIAVVAAARERGVDVLLLDDSGGAGDDRLIELILTWMAAEIATARTRAVGRLLPSGRDAQANLTIDGRHTEFAVDVSVASAQTSSAPSRPAPLRAR